MTTYTIEQVERAINVWRARHASGQDGALYAEARILATPCTLMFLDQRTSIEAHELSEVERGALRAALGQTELAL